MCNSISNSIRDFIQVFYTWPLRCVTCRPILARTVKPLRLIVQSTAVRTMRLVAGREGGAVSEGGMTAAQPRLLRLLRSPRSRTRRVLAMGVLLVAVFAGLSGAIGAMGTVDPRLLGHLGGQPTPTPTATPIPLPSPTPRPAPLSRSGTPSSPMMRLRDNRSRH